MIRIWLVVTALMLFVGAPALAAVASNIAPPAANQLLKERKNVYLLDVRTLGEYQQMRLADAHLIPIDEVMRRISEIPQDHPVVVYCAVGSRSAQVFNYLARRGYREVYNLEGGIYAWAQNGYPVIKGRP